MMRNEERRASGTRRVGMQKLVEMCGIDPSVTPAFEAESVNVSGRGMHLRTAYLPPLGSQLVCRFEDRGREIIAEGLVAWRNEAGRGGEFGLMFTALDSGSVDALRALTGTPQDEPKAIEPAQPPATTEPAPLTDPGSRVRLHIDGLGAPMKALVKNSTRSRVKVGSNLEFLKVGRRLEIENLDQGNRRQASIDGIDVVIDPQSGVPQLVVALHYADVDDLTPEPSVVDDTPLRSRGAPSEQRIRIPAAVASPTRAPTLRHSATVPQAPKAVAPATVDEDDAGPLPEDMELSASQSGALEGDDEEIVPANESSAEEEDDAAIFRGRFGVMATQAGDLVKNASSVLARLGSGAATGLGSLVRGGGKGRDASTGRDAKGDSAPRRRVTSAPVAPAVEGRRLRPQSGGGRGAPNSQGKESAPESKASTPAPTGILAGKRARRVGSAAAGIALLGTVVVMASNRATPPPGAETDKAPGAAHPVTASTAATSQAGDREAKVERLREPAPSGSGVIADVPLFGPTPMATLEPAPLDTPPPPAPNAGSPAIQGPPSDEEESPTAEAVPAAHAASAVPDEVFEKAAASKEAKPEEVKPWGRGKLTTPTVYRLRLDGPGMAINGSATSTGFSVTIPGRKVLEAGDSITKRDKRFSKVATKNSPAGAQISFGFREGVPGYRVRLRRDFIEFLVSAPNG